MKFTRKNDHLKVDLEVADEFIPTRSTMQRDSLINRQLLELFWNLENLHKISPSLVPGGQRTPIEGSLTTGPVTFESGKLKINDQVVMEDWQPRLMNSLAEIVSKQGGHVLEIGFGLGMSASRIQEIGVQSHTIVECNPEMIERFERWKQQYPGRDINILKGTWQERKEQFQMYDGILFDTFPITEDEWKKAAYNDVTLAQNFFETASAHLNKKGVFTYFTNEIDSLSREHQRSLFNYFEEISIKIIDNLNPPSDSFTWYAPTKALVKAIK